MRKSPYTCSKCGAIRVDEKYRSLGENDLQVNLKYECGAEIILYRIKNSWSVGMIKSDCDPEKIKALGSVLTDNEMNSLVETLENEDQLRKRKKGW